MPPRGPRSFGIRGEGSPRWAPGRPWRSARSPRRRPWTRDRRPCSWPRQPVVARSRHKIRVPHRNAGDVGHGDRLLVVGEPVGGHPFEVAKGRIQEGDEGGQLAIPRGQHDPVTAPGQPRAKQRGRASLDDRAGGPVPLQPQAPLGHPGPIDPPAPARVDGLGLAHGPAGGALGALVAHRRKAPVGAIGPVGLGRSPGRRWGILVTATGELRGRQWGEFHVRRQPSTQPLR